MMLESGSGRRGKGGFSLLELLVALAVMTILGGLGFSGLSGLRRWMGQQETLALFRELESACRMYRMERGSWPESLRAGEVALNAPDAAWREDLAPYLERRVDAGTLADGFGNTDLRMVVDADGDHWIRESEMRGGIGRDLWKRIAVYSLDGDGRLVMGSW